MGNANRFYYRHSRQLIRLKADFQGEIIGQKLRWLGGISFFGNRIDSVDVDGLNEDKEDDQLSYNSLYGNYVEWGMIPEEQAEGGRHTLLKAGLVYDTRDNEPNPFNGIWTEMQLHYAPSFLSNTDYSYASLVLTHRQYFTMIPEWMNLAYRLSYQGKIAGEMPFYMMPYLFQYGSQADHRWGGRIKNRSGCKAQPDCGRWICLWKSGVKGKDTQNQCIQSEFLHCPFSLCGRGNGHPEIRF